MRDNGKVWFEERLAAPPPALTAVCDRCHQPCAPRSEMAAGSLAVWKRKLNAEREVGLQAHETPLLCRACYLVHRDMLGEMRTAEAHAAAALDAVERYERWCDDFARCGGERPPAPEAFFRPATLRGEHANRISVATRRARAGGNNRGDM